MKSSSPIRIGIIGAGDITRTRHLPGLKKIPGVRLVAVCNRSEASSREVAREWGFERIARTPAEILRARDIDAVMVGTWPYLHKTLCCAALRAGKHVFTQARMARNAAEARQMLREAQRHPRLVAMICPSPYAMKSALFVGKLIRDGFVGKIRLVRFNGLASGFADSATPIHWRQERRLNGVNTLCFGIIMERLLQWLGPVESVSAKGTIFTPWRKDGRGKRVRVTNHDQLLVTAQLRDHPGQIHLTISGAVRHPPADRVEIYGDRGTLTVDLSNDEVRGARVGEKVLKRLPIPKALQRAWTVEADFIEAIRAGGYRRLPKSRTAFFSPDFVEGMRYMLLTEATIRAASTGGRVRVSR